MNPMRLTHGLRGAQAVTATATVGAAIVLALTACSPGDAGGRDDPGATEKAGCGDCTTETAALKKKIAQIKGVTKLSYLEYVPGKSIRLNPTLTMDAYIATGSLDKVRPAIVKAAWDSRITPLTEITLNFQSADNGFTELRSRFIEGTKEYEAYRDAWGPRPVK